MNGKVNSALGSVRFRVTAGVTVLFLLSMVATSWLLVSQVRSRTTAAIRTQSESEARLLASQLEASGVTGVTGVLPTGQSGTVFALVDPSGTVVGESGSAVATSQTVVGIVGDESTTTSKGALPVTIDGREYELRATSPLEPVIAAVDALVGMLTVVGPLLVLAVALLSWIAVGRSLRPVEAIIERTDEISASSLDGRVPVPPGGDEIARLAATVNRMLARIQASSESQRRFVSDASHELRSPVAASRVQLEVALGEPGGVDWPSTARTVLAEQVRLGRLVDDLLLIARLDEAGEPRRMEVDLDDLVFEEAARGHRVNVDASAVAPVRIHGDPALLRRLVGNLVENAVRHAAGRVGVSLSPRGRYAALVVEDDGDGIPESMRESVFGRFTRLEDARVRDAGGAGLGLAVVREVARAHGGEVRVVESELGGARFEVRLPLE